VGRKAQTEDETFKKKPEKIYTLIRFLLNIDFSKIRKILKMKIELKRF
jgi:hypothetical protein